MNKKIRTLKKKKILTQILMLHIFLMSCYFSIPSYSQTSQVITLNLKHVSVIEIIREIQKVSNYHFLYQTDELKTLPKRDYKVTNTSINGALDELVSNTNLSYRIDKDMILIKMNHQQKKTYQHHISGVVLDEEGNYLPGVSIKIGNTSQGTTTDSKGHFIINEPDSNGKTILHFSYIGMIPQAIAYTGKEIKVTMHEDSKMIDEVVVTGYQTLNRRESASAISTIHASDIMIQGMNSIDQMMQGTIPGLAVMNTSGEPSATPKIRIRGNATINGNKSPVWVVDGVILEQNVPFTASDINSEDAEYLIGNAISGINPQDIETITVLKDASATAIYGVKAANGVIVVTTKKGKAGRPLVTYNGNITLNSRPSYDNFKLMNSQERVQFSKSLVDSGINFGSTPYGPSYEGAYEELISKKITLDEFKEKVNTLQTQNTDWFKHLFSNSITHTHNVNISGGTDKIKYYMSAGYYDVEGSARSASSKKFTTLAKITADINKHINLLAKINFSTTSNKGYGSSIDPFTYAYNRSRTIPLYNSDGSLYYSHIEVSSSSLGSNPVGFNILNELDNTGKSSKLEDYNALLQLNIKIIQDLKYEGTFSYYNSNTSTRDWATANSYTIGVIRGYDYGAYDAYDNAYWKSPLPYGGRLSQSNIRKSGYTIRNQINFNKIIFDKHHINIIGGIEARRNQYKGVSQTGYGWVPEFGEQFNPVMTESYIANYAENRATDPINTNSFTQVASFYGLASYEYSDLYIFSANIRSDGSNKFGSNPKYRWLPTYSFAIKWNLMNEPFMKAYKWIDNLAFRGSYGLQGNINVDDSPYLIVTTGTRDNVLGLPISNIKRLPNPDLRWEKTHSWDAAIDFSFFNERIRGGIDFYGKKTKDLIMTKTVASSNGRTSLYYNAGKMDNKGYEGFINFGIIKNKEWSWRFGVNFSCNKNNITYANPEDLSENEIINKMLSGTLAVEGSALGSLYSYHFAGINQDIGYPMFYTKSGKLSILGTKPDMELVKTGTIFPKLTGGFDTQINYKNFSLSMDFTYSFGSKSRLPEYYTNNTIDPLSNLSQDWLKCWKQSGDETIYPAPYNSLLLNNYFATESGSLYNTYDSNVSNRVRPYSMYNYSDIRVAKMDFIKMKMLALSYNFPRKYLESINISQLLLRFQVTNLFTIANKKWNGLDPETRTNIPSTPTYSFSVNVSF